MQAPSFLNLRSLVIPEGHKRVVSLRFPNLFRYKILFEKGGIWADLDFLCLRPLHELPDACLGRMVWESREQLNVALMKFPVGHLICKTLYEKAKTLGQNIDVGEASNVLVSAVLGQVEVPCTIFRCQHSIQFIGGKRGSFLIQRKPHIVRLK